MARTNIEWGFLAGIVGCGGHIDANISAGDAGVVDAVVADAVADGAVVADAVGVADAPHYVPCTATALTPLATANTVDHIVVGRDGYIYFQGDGVLRVPKNGGPATLVVPGLYDMMYLSTFALAGDSIAWFRVDPNLAPNSPSILEHTSLDGTKTTDAITLGPGFYFVATAPSHELVWGPSWESNPYDPRLHDVHNGIATSLTPPSSGEVYRAVADAEGVFFLATPAGVAKRNGDAFELLDPTPAFALAVDDKYAYFASPAGVERLDKQGGTPEVIVQVFEPGSVAVDAENVYFGGSSSRVGRVPKSGGSVTTLYTADPGTYLEDVALDDECAYFGVNGPKGGTLFVSPK